MQAVLPPQEAEGRVAACLTMSTNSVWPPASRTKRAVCSMTCTPQRLCLSARRGPAGCQPGAQALSHLVRPRGGWQVASEVWRHLEAGLEGVCGLLGRRRRVHGSPLWRGRHHRRSLRPGRPPRRRRRLHKAGCRPVRARQLGPPLQPCTASPGLSGSWRARPRARCRQTCTRPAPRPTAAPRHSRADRCARASFSWAPCSPAGRVVWLCTWCRPAGAGCPAAGARRSGPPGWCRRKAGPAGRLRVVQPVGLVVHHQLEGQAEAGKALCTPSVGAPAGRAGGARPSAPPVPRARPAKRSIAADPS